MPSTNRRKGEPFPCAVAPSRPSIGFDSYIALPCWERHVLSDTGARKIVSISLCAPHVHCRILPFCETGAIAYWVIHVRAPGGGSAAQSLACLCYGP